MSLLFRAIKWLGLLVACAPSVAGLYLLAALAGAYVQLKAPQFQDSGEKVHTVYLVTGLLHADITIEATPELIERFAFLRSTTLPLDSPDLRYLAFGWGSKAFYTTSGSYSDLTFSAVARAVTGDDAVMRVTAFGDVTKFDGNIVVQMSDAQMERLLNFIRRNFEAPGSASPQYMAGVSTGPGDAFYVGNSHFNIFHPCNQWVNEGFRYAGISTGVWTPTIYSLRHSLAWFGSSQ